MPRPAAAPTCALPLRIPVPLRERLDRLCVEQRVTKTTVLIAALERELDRREKGAKK